MKTHFTIMVSVPKGEGDYGTDRKTVFDKPTTIADAKQFAQSASNLFRGAITELYKGKHVGRLVQTFGHIEHGEKRL